MRILTSAVAMMVLGLAVPISAADKVAVFVTSSTASRGATEPDWDTQEATDDVRALVADQPDLKAVARRDQAKIVLVVQSCAYDAVPGSRQPQARIEAKFVVGQMESVVEGTGHVRVSGVGRDALRALAARDMARQVNSWVTENRAKIR